MDGSDSDLSDYYSDSQLGSDGSDDNQSFVELLLTDPDFIDLNAAEENLGDEGIIEIAEAIKENTVLCSLNVAENGIGPKGANFLSRVLGFCTAFDRYRDANALSRLEDLVAEKQRLELERKKKEEEEARLKAEQEEKEEKDREEEEKKESIIENFENRETPSAFRSESPDKRDGETTNIDKDDDESSLSEKLSNDVEEDILRSLSPSEEADDFIPVPTTVCCPSLTALNISENPIGPHASANLLRTLCPRLEEIRAEGIGASWLGAFAVAHAIEEHEDCALRCLDLSHNNIEDKGAIRLAKSISIAVKREIKKRKKNEKPGPLQQLRALFLNSNGIGPEGVAAICDAIRYHRRIEVVQLRFNRILVDGASKIAGVMRYNKSITHLDLRSCALGDKGARRLGSALSANEKICQLWLAGNQIGDVGGKYFFKGLAENKCLLELDMHCNYMKDESALALGEALQKNTTLVTLNLRENQFGCDAACNISKGLKKNIKLRNLDLSRNHIANEGAYAIGKSLQTSLALVYLDISENAIGAKGGTMLEGCRSACTEMRNDIHMEKVKTRALERGKFIKMKENLMKKKLQKKLETRNKKREKIRKKALQLGLIQPFSFHDSSSSSSNDDDDDDEKIRKQEFDFTLIQDSSSTDITMNIDQIEEKIVELSNPLEQVSHLYIETGNNVLLGDPGFLYVQPKMPSIHTTKFSELGTMRRHKKVRSKKKNLHHLHSSTSTFKSQDPLESRPSTNYAKRFEAKINSRPHTGYSSASNVSFTTDLTNYDGRKTDISERVTRRAVSRRLYEAELSRIGTAATTGSRQSMWTVSGSSVARLLDMSHHPYSQQRGLLGTPLFGTTEKIDRKPKTRPKTIRRKTKTTSNQLWLEPTNKMIKHQLFEHKEQEQKDIEEEKKEEEAKKKAEEEARLAASSTRSTTATTAFGVQLQSRSTTAK
eukprot:g4591.t1